MGQLALGADKILVAAGHHLAGHLAQTALPGQHLQVGGGAVLDSVRLGLAQHGAGQRVLTAGFQPGSQAQQKFGRHVAGAHHLHHAGGAGGHRAVLVQQDGPCPGGAFQGVGGLEQHALPQRGVTPGQSRGGGGQAQRAWAADRQHADRPRQGGRQAAAQQHPDHKGCRSHRRGGQAQYPAGAQGGLGGGAFAPGGLTAQADGLRQGGGIACLLRPAGQGSVLVDRPGKDPVAGCLVHRGIAAGDRRLAHAGAAFQHHAVGGEGAAGLDQEDLAGGQVAGGNVHRLAITRRGGLAGQCLQPACQCLVGAVQQPVLGIPSGTAQCRDGPRGTKSNIAGIAARDARAQHGQARQPAGQRGRGAQPGRQAAPGLPQLTQCTREHPAA